jgi:AraC-like DNA-binding protein
MLDKDASGRMSEDLAWSCVTPSYWAHMGKELIDRHYARLQKVEDVSSILGISTGHFRDVFRTAYGVPPKLYLANVKVEKALELLRDSSVMVCDVAMRVGIPQRNVFKRTFKRFIGVTPSEYQRRSASNEIDSRKRPAK